MNDPADEIRTLIPLDSHLPSTPHEGSAKSIQKRMVLGALEIARRKLHDDTHHWLGGYELAEPDYRQVLLWAEQLRLVPEDVLERLAKCKFVGRLETCSATRYLDQDVTHKTLGLEIINGRFKTLVLDSRALPLRAFEWLPGLSIETLVVTGRMPSWTENHPLPKLRELFVAELGLTQLDLRGYPARNLLR